MSNANGHVRTASPYRTVPRPTSTSGCRTEPCQPAISQLRRSRRLTGRHLATLVGEIPVAALWSSNQIAVRGLARLGTEQGPVERGASKPHHCSNEHRQTCELCAPPKATGKAEGVSSPRCARDVLTEARTVESGIRVPVPETDRSADCSADSAELFNDEPYDVLHPDPVQRSRRVVGTSSFAPTRNRSAPIRPVAADGVRGEDAHLSRVDREQASWVPLRRLSQRPSCRSVSPNLSSDPKDRCDHEPPAEHEEGAQRVCDNQRASR